MDRHLTTIFMFFQCSIISPEKLPLFSPSSSTVYFDIWFRDSRKSKGNLPMYFRLNKHSPDNNCLILRDSITMKMFDSFGNIPFQYSREFPELGQNGCCFLVSTNYSWNIFTLWKQEVPILWSWSFPYKYLIIKICIFSFLLRNFCALFVCLEHKSLFEKSKKRLG